MLRNCLVVATAVAANVVTTAHAAPRGRLLPSTTETTESTNGKPLRRSNHNMMRASRIPVVDGDYPDVIGVKPLPQEQEPIDASVYTPGDFRGNLRSNDSALRLCNGLSARVVATQGNVVPLANGSVSKVPFQSQPNGGAVFPKGHGGWVYVTNSRSASPLGRSSTDSSGGGVGALEFDIEGDLIGYERLLTGTLRNRGGGMTPWNTWITCEHWGCRQVDPTGEKEPAQTALGIIPDLAEFAFCESSDVPQFFLTQNDDSGVLTRFVPDENAMECYNQAKQEDRWCTLASGQHDFLVLHSDRTFSWSTEYDAAQASAFEHFRDAKSITVNDGKLYIVSKALNQVVCLNLDVLSYTITSRAAELEPLVGNSTFFFPEGPNVFGRDEMDKEKYFILFFTDALPSVETIGVVESPDQKHLYVSYQETGLIYDVQRIDSEPFQGPFVDINYLALV